MRRKTIIWTIIGLLLIIPLKTNFQKRESNTPPLQKFGITLIS